MGRLAPIFVEDSLPIVEYNKDLRVLYLDPGYERVRLDLDVNASGDVSVNGHAGENGGENGNGCDGGCALVYMLASFR